ncbi:MAG: 4Fe-4S binding protein [Bacteroides sp.]|nr:4Fe-4S binding protein [Bacteroides sp.]
MKEWNENRSYLNKLFYGIGTLLTGLKTSITVFFRRKTTEQYPENRKELVMFDRFRGTLIMPHNEHNEHKCIACGLCQNTCPNETIEVISRTEETAEGKKKKVLAAYHYDLGCCMFCQLCVNICPTGAIRFDTQYENAVFNRDLLVKTLNHPGSKVIEKK